METSVISKLTYRRQFILTNKSIEVDKSWKILKISKKKVEFTIYSHPDLEVISAANVNYGLVLLGYIIDPFSPVLGSDQVLKHLASNFNFRGILNDVSSLSGRFVIVYYDENKIYIINDATAFREVYYTKLNDVVACGSTPDILAKYLSIEKDTEKHVNDFYNSAKFNRREHIWIGTRTIYKDVNHLFSNHYLDLHRNKAVRFWPYDYKRPVKLKEAGGIISQILIGTYDAAILRYRLMQGLTSGWDSKILLSTCKKHLDKIRFYFNRGFKADALSAKGSPDYKIAIQIAMKNNIPLEIFDFKNSEIAEEFSNIYFGNNILARQKLLKVYYDVYTRGLEDYITVSGTMSNEIMRLVPGSILYRNSITPENLAGFLRYAEFSYVIESIKDWLFDVDIFKDMGYSPVDLFYWEQYIGNWGNLSGSEQDIVREELRPFNNRILLSTYSSLLEKFRYRDFPMGHVQVIKEHWPELLNFKMDTTRYRTKKLLRLLGLEQLVDKTFYRMRQSRKQIQ